MLIFHQCHWFNFQERADDDEGGWMLCTDYALLLCPSITPPLAQEIAMALHRGGGWGYQISLNNNNNSVAFWFHDCSLMFWNPWARTGGHVKYGVSLAIFLRQVPRVRFTGYIRYYAQQQQKRRPNERALIFFGAVVFVFPRWCGWWGSLPTTTRKVLCLGLPCVSIVHRTAVTFPPTFINTLVPTG